MKKQILCTALIVGLLASCNMPGLDTPASPPTEPLATSTLTFTDTPAPSATAFPTNTLQPTNTQVIQISFANDILPLFQNHCKNCHGGNKTEEGLNLLSYASVMQGSKNGLIVIPGDASNSLLVDMLVKQKMPKKGPKLTTAEIQIIIDWINQGALDN